MAEPIVSQHTLCSANASLRVENSTGLNDVLSEVPFTDNEDVFATMILVERYTLPILCVFGLVGNTLSTVTFLRQPLRKAPCSLYLAARGVSDNGFLFSLLMIWTSSTFQLRLSQVQGVCQTIIFTTYLCGCVSVWLCVFITFENFLLIQNPFFCRRVPCDIVSKICIVALVILSVGFYHISLWIVNEDCSHNPEYMVLTQVLVYTDTLLTLVIPTVVIFILLTLIAYKVVQILHIRRLHHNLLEKIENDHRPTKQIVPIAKVTKMLFVVSLTFCALNVPSHAIRLRILIESVTTGAPSATMLQRTLQSIFFLLYYLSFSINIIVYASFGSNFRRTFRKTFCRSLNGVRRRNVPNEAVNSVRHRRSSVYLNLDTNDNTRQCLITTDDNFCHSQISVRLV